MMIGDQLIQYLEMAFHMRQREILDVHELQDGLGRGPCKQVLQNFRINYN
jgi:hypothetical protein